MLDYLRFKDGLRGSVYVALGFGGEGLAFDVDTLDVVLVRTPRLGGGISTQSRNRDFEEILVLATDPCRVLEDASPFLGRRLKGRVVCFRFFMAESLWRHRWPQSQVLYVEQTGEAVLKCL